ncbi:uncharacterized protein I303_107118 [Kwoniella dejecticola CBS 10117]|uniref:GH18 domain-containing protein n=1 Tax=Kwoniella dejecticola CBS 10117 TaxID=1296121 RepID=A0A1A5ZYT1_9TREE|nr:uncharacterized protein I303_06520 [Kwoniella dejecticola CBS 10117]OBR82962.1 hypothetical protein I303_06520 [Kwoniella dejecticola CBS 10117]
MHHPLTKPSSFLFALSFLFSPSASVSAQHRNLPRNPRQHPHLDERLMPITATTTVVVQRTATHTVWVQPTEQVVVSAPGIGGGSGSGSGSDGERSSSSSSSSVSVESSSAVPTISSTSSSVETASASSFADSASISLASAASASVSATPSGSVVASASSSEFDGSAVPSETFISDFPSASYTSSLASSTIGASSFHPAHSSIYPSDIPSSSSYSSNIYSTSSSAVESSITDASYSSSSQGGKSASTSSSSSSASAEGSSSSSSSISDFLSSATSHSHSASRTSTSASTSQTASITDAETASLTESETASRTASLTASETGSLSLNETEAVTATSASDHPSVTATSTLWPNITSTLTSDFASSTSTNLPFSESLTSSFEPSSSPSASASLNISATASVTSTSSSALASASASSGLQPIESTIMAAYYPDWAASHLSPEQVDWTRFDVVDFAFALPTSDNNLQFTQDDSEDLLKRLVKAGHANGKRVKLSIGGWTGSAYFSTICGNSWSRSTFVSNILAAYNNYGLDGIDIDWEYPGTTGADGNAISNNDSANFLLFLQELRAALPSGALITTATQVWPFAGSNGSPMSDVSEFAKVIDWILIMNYDIWGSSSTPGPNAPLSDACGNSTQPLANAYAAVSSWTGAGMPANQITLGVPAYGYLQQSSANSLKQKKRSAFPQPPHKNSTRNEARASKVTIYNDWGGSSDGQIMFDDLITQGALKLVDGEYVGTGGFVRHWDACSSTPWIKSTYSDQIITYDDTQSMNLKGQFAAQVGLRGCNMFSIDGDWTGSSWPLTDAVRSGLGL